ncbi:N-acetyl-1-D-myo-inositol-2-amino-2-deoxy-alpha-D-glucopyranoside deacetylase [Gordonia zhaorongruii]|uniref:N-acetyl-1-D-myo-inositol-2-amino-2-deoxy-alpha- D-glucopyranoside deacetylase n=1 Tax=Gordonia zhaorongruii TaxID=2597659 RepID=UPI0010500EF6|nr:N-acetyl-1-D-myo-inositol-2-amino-2-deoxy-alpha-D-glucopyranoside deacetylase [Gordonia zhaorongruii]
MTVEPLRLLLLHAHPDDESLMTGGVIARYLAEGADVRVVTFTLGEEGEVIGDEWAQLVADGGADQLGGFRIAELTTALRQLAAGADRIGPRFLGGAGRWRDSGMAGTPSAEHPRALVQAAEAELVSALRAEIDGFAPHVIVTYDEAGTYGHPDHKRVHEISVGAIALSRAETGFPCKVYESVTQRSALNAGLAAITDLPEGWRLPERGELPSYPDDQVTASVDVSGVLAAKVAALAAHATQVTVAPSGTEYALSNRIAQPVHAVEHFIRTDPGATGRHETDLFEGLR